MDKFITKEEVGGREGTDKDYDHDDEPQKKKKMVRNITYKKKHKVIVKTQPSVNDVTENINKLAIRDDNDDISENIITLYSKSGKHMFQYSNKKTPFENACPWL
jgi:hypothetical protein